MEELGSVSLLVCDLQSRLSTARRTARNCWAVPLQLWSNELVYLCLFTCRAALKMSGEKEQRVCIKFCIKVGEKRAETFEMLKIAFGDECLSHASTFLHA